MKAFTESTAVFIVFRSLVEYATESSIQISCNHFSLDEASKNKSE
jgi:hypothetical protein